MASYLNPPNQQSHVCNFSQLIRDIRHVGLTRLLSMKVEIISFRRCQRLYCGLLLAPAVGLWAPSGSFGHLFMRSVIRKVTLMT